MPNHQKTIFLGLSSVMIALGGMLMGIIGITCSLVFYFSQPGMAIETRAEAYIYQFQTDSSPSSRLSSLAGLFKLGEGNPVYHEKALNLFEGLSRREQQALFNLTAPQEVGDALVIVVENIYVTLKIAPDGGFNPSPLNTHQNQLLQLMASSLNRLVNQTALKQAGEIEGWLGGRQYATRQNYEAARDAYSAAIFINGNNPLTHYERALVFMALDDYDEALTDFNKAVQLDQNLLDDVLAVNVDDNKLNDYLWINSGKYPYLARLITPPTATNTATPTQPVSTAIPAHTQTPIPARAEPAVANIPGQATPTIFNNAIPVDTPAPIVPPESIVTTDDTASTPAPAVVNLQSNGAESELEKKVRLFLNIPPFVSVQGRIHVELVISNTSDITLTNIVLTDKFTSPEKVVFPREFEPDIFNFNGSDTIEWRRDAINPHDEARFRWLGTVKGNKDDSIKNLVILNFSSVLSPNDRLSKTKEVTSYIRPVTLALSIEAPTVIKPGESLFYTMDVINVGEAAAFDIKVRASIDKNIVNPGHISEGGELNAGPDEGATGVRQVIWQIDRLDPGAGRTLSWKGEIDPFITPVATEVKSKAEVLNPTATVISTPKPEVITRVYSEPVRPILNATLNSYPGGPYVSTLTIQNTGHKVHRIVAIQPLPPCVQRPTNISHGGIFEGNRRIVWHLNTLEALETANLTWQGTICLNTTNNNNDTNGDLHSITSAAAITIADLPQPTPVPAITYLQPVLLLNKTATEQVGPGELITYTLKVETRGGTQQTNDNNFGVVVVRDPIPGNIGDVDVSSITSPGQVVGNEIVWEITNLEANRTKTLVWTGTIDSQTPVGTEIVNVATANDEWGQLVNAEARTVVASQSVNLNLFATSPITTGGPITYTIQVQNTGQTALFGVDVEHPVPTHITSVITSSNNGGTVDLPTGSNTLVTWNLPRLDAGAMVELVWWGTVASNTPAEQTEIRSEAKLETSSGLEDQDDAVSTFGP